MNIQHALNVTEAAEFLGVSTTTIYLHARAGTIPSHRVGKLWRFFAHELSAETVHDPWRRSSQSQARLGRKRVFEK